MESNTTKFTLDATKKIKALIENDEAQVLAILQLII